MSVQRYPGQDPLSAEKLQLFVAGLSGLPPEEVRKAKSLFIRNAISEYRMVVESTEAFGCAQKLFWIIPLFWPILFAQRRMVEAHKRLFQERIRNALEVWKDDLEGETFDFGDEQFTL